MFKTIKGLTLVYLQNSFSMRCTQYNFRDSGAKLKLPMTRTNYGKRAFCYSGALLWNNLPISLRKSDSLGYFKREIDQLYGGPRLGSHTANLLNSVVVTKPFIAIYNEAFTVYKQIKHIKIIGLWCYSFNFKKKIKFMSLHM